MDISKLIEKAREAAERRNYDYAVDLYNQALQLSPDDSQARRDLRTVEHRLAKERGVSFMGKAKVMAALGKAKTLLATKKFDAAMIACEDALKIDPGSISALMTLGSAALTAGYKNAAIVTFEEIRAGKGGGNLKSLVEGSRNLAFAYEANGQAKEALEIWEEVKRLKPDDRDATIKIRDLSAIGMVTRVEAGTNVGAAAGKMAATKGIMRSQENVERQERSQQDIRTEEDLRLAIEDTKADIHKRPDDARIYGKLGDLYKKGNNYDEAKKAYQTAVEKDAINPTWKFRLDDLEIWRMANAVNALAAKFKAGDVSARDLHGKQLIEMLEYRRRSFVERERQYTTDGRIKYDLAEIYFELAARKRDGILYDEAIKRYQVTFKDPKYRIESGLKMGMGFAAKGQYELAIKRFEETLGHLELKDDRWKNLMYYKADTLEKGERFKEALEIFLQIYEVDVSFRDVSKRVEELQKKTQGDAAD
ncbi:MAG: hypothetical protein M5U26_25095 [Planctomycetota bacterium]|nr:hypothetical protein [Planctomycetota bacterium]